MTKKEAAYSTWTLDWHKIEDGLPEIEHNVLVCERNGSVYSSWREDGGWGGEESWWWASGCERDDIVAWAEPPPPYEEA